MSHIVYDYAGRPKKLVCVTLDIEDFGHSLHYVGIEDLDEVLTAIESCIKPMWDGFRPDPASHALNWERSSRFGPHVIERIFSWGAVYVRDVLAPEHFALQEYCETLEDFRTRFSEYFNAYEEYVMDALDEFGSDRTPE